MVVTISIRVFTSIAVEAGRTASKKGVLMCYNCGCQMPDNDMGNPKNITNKTFEEAAKASGQTVEQAKKNTAELLQKTSADKK